MIKKIIIAILAFSIPSACAVPSTMNELEDVVNVDILEDEETAIQIEVVEKQWKCEECTPEEKYILSELQKETRITDRNALATILGNIKQESNFRANICEGGARVPYDRCYSGGYGLIQWTTLGRYNGLGSFCAAYGCDPSSLEGQTRYMINEDIFQRYLPMFEGSGQTVQQYMVPAYYWLGWGIKGNREIYAYDYTKKLVWT
jgi:hypothetical protein